MTENEKRKMIESGRCENCGWAKKEHGRVKPWKCPTRLQESYYTPWTFRSLDTALATAAKESR
jgi:predicted Zn-ribbon and HTH transcriptional regulator